MLPDILLKIETTLRQESSLSLTEISHLCSKFTGFKKGSLVYPSIIKRHLGISLKESYEVLNHLVDAEILTLCFQIECPEYTCCEVYREVFDQFNEIPNDLTCEQCGYEFNKLKDVKVIYRVNQ